MAGYLARRFLTAIVVCLGVTLVSFVMLHIAAPNPGQAALGARASQAAIAAYDKQNGYDRPIPVQFVTYLNHFIHGQLGWSYKFNQSVNALFAEKTPLSAFLTGISLLLAVVIAIPLGIYQAVKRNGMLDAAATTVAFVLYSTPVYLVALILQHIFADQLGWVSANVSQDQSLAGALSDFKDLLLPILSLTAVAVAGFSRYQRSSSLDVLAQDYIRVARAKGLSERLVYTRHLLRNAILPTITLLGLYVPFFIAGNILIEYTFNIDGLGLLFINALTDEDYNILISYTLIGAILTVIGNLIADLALAAADPRIRIA
ncbi:MAG TPA: ABC transporter permease [Actinocrinis sp.]|jgi:peptide/nickel transport system permease protein